MSWHQPRNPSGIGLTRSQPIQLIAAVGKMRAGKSTFAHFLDGEGYERMAFADPIKDATVGMLNLFFGRIGHPLEVDRAWLDAHKTMVRPILQCLGNDIGRDYVSDTVWIDLFRNEVWLAKRHTYHMPTLIVCDDCRYPNEAQALREMGFLIVKLVRDEPARLASIRVGVEEMLVNQTPFGHVYVPNEARIEAEIAKVLDHPSERAVDDIIPDVEVSSESPQQLADLAEAIARRGEIPPDYVIRSSAVL